MDKRIHGLNLHLSNYPNESPDKTHQIVFRWCVYNEIDSYFPQFFLLYPPFTIPQGQDVGLQSCITADDYESNGHGYTLRNLSPGNYSVEVTPITVAGAGNVSAIYPPIFIPVIITRLIGTAPRLLVCFNRKVLVFF